MSSHALKPRKGGGANTAEIGPAPALRKIREKQRRNEDLRVAKLLEAWQAAGLSDPEDCLTVGKAFLDQRRYDLAGEVFQAVLDEAELSRSGYFPASRLKEVRKYLLYAQALSGCAAYRGADSGPPVSTHEDHRPSQEQSVAEEYPAIPEEQPTLDPFAGGTVPGITIDFHVDATPVMEAIRVGRSSDARVLELALQAYRHSFRTSYDQLICLPSLRNMQSLWYQEETARKVMKHFRGRAILADEVGLGKTIEAGLVLKEYMLRGLVRTVLILTPSSLVNQWQEELRDKFDIELPSSNDALFRENPQEFWKRPMIVASLHTARIDRHFDAVVSRSYDMVIVDEAHHLKNRSTKSWKLVNAVKKSFLLLLTATPVQNHLEELYNLVTILKPGHLKTRSSFKEQFLTRGNPQDPRNRALLRDLLQDVMIRNTRSVTQLRLPPRFASTTRVRPTSVEEDFYGGVSELVTACARSGYQGLKAMALRKLLEAAGSSHIAACRSLLNWSETGDAKYREPARDLISAGRSIGLGTKTAKVLELLKATREQKVIFVNYRATLEHLAETLSGQGIDHAVFHGGLSAAQKQASIERFRSGCPVLLATGTAGEGHNLQFCHVMINYDLPWNPMEIEQRIGRIHRIGQDKEVHIHNFCSVGTIEDRILHVLDRKINMFELVVGEVDMILGRLQDESDFADQIFEIWTRHQDQEERGNAFEDLGERLQQAKQAYEKSTELGNRIFQEDFGI